MMARRSIAVSIATMLAVLVSACAANATPSCMRDIKPYRLDGDTMEWSMTIAPGADCIQGLRWSTMQIYNVAIEDKPKSGDLVLVGPGFRYYAKADFEGTDTFTLAVVGKNRRDEGTSKVRITISGPKPPLVMSAVSQPE